MEIIKNQQLKSLDILSVLTHIVLVVALIVGVYVKDTLSGRYDRAKAKAESLAFQAMQVDSLKLQQTDEIITNPRMPASTSIEQNLGSRIGEDPWGRKYFYHIPSSGPVAIWSVGSNGLDETSSLISDQALATNPYAIQAGGDDVLSLVSTAPRKSHSFDQD